MHVFTFHYHYCTVVVYCAVKKYVITPVSESHIQLWHGYAAYSTGLLQVYFMAHVEAM